MIKTKISLSKYNRFQTGGDAEYFFAPESVHELSDFLRNNKIRPITVIGMGSNVLVSDSGISGLVIHTGKLNDVNINGTEIICGAGTAMPKIASLASKHKIAGFEFMIGIPGTVGGGLITNAGCFGGQISDCLVSILGVDFSGNIIELSVKDCGLSYRTSNLPDDFIITELRFRGCATDADLNEKMSNILAKKTASQPADARTAGSTFKNPHGVPAWKIIKEKFPGGLSIGGARISEKHANFIIADKECTSTDIKNLISEIQKQTGLELEIKILGNW